MGKVRDDAPASTSKTVAKPAPRQAPRRAVQFLANLFRGDRYKPTQGKHARLWTAIGLGLVFAAGLFQFQTYYLDELPIVARYSIPLVIGAILAWIVWRIIEFPPFADFLIATEGEMNKVSWISRDELQRATGVVLTTVLLLSMFLFGVDWLWASLLQLFGVLKFGGGGAFGSQAG